MPPAQASALVHTAEVFTTGASGAWHIFHGNVDWRLMLRLGIAGVAGAVLGAWILSSIDATFMRPYVSAYLLLMGIYILLKAMQAVPPRDAECRGRRRSDSSRASSMPAAAAAGGRSPRRR